MVKIKEYSVAEARYAKDKWAVTCPSSDGLKSRAAALAEYVGGRWSNREGAYILSRGQLRKFEQLWKDGAVASTVTKRLWDKGKSNG